MKLTKSYRDCWSKPRRKRGSKRSSLNRTSQRLSANRIRPGRNLSRSSLHSYNDGLTLDDVIDQRISELGLPGLV